MKTTTVDAAPTQPTWREWAGLALLALPMFMMATDFTVMFMAMPAVTADLAPSTTQALWIVHIGEFVAAGLVITMGWLTGRTGPRFLLLTAMGLYGGASALAAYAPNPETLLVARVLIGLAAAAASPAAIAMVRSMFTSAKHFSVAFAMLMGAFSAGGALGPPMGGVLLEYFWWGSVFLINVPVAALALIAGFGLFPRAAERTHERIDMTSVALSMAAVILVVFGLQEIADQGFSLPHALAALAGIALGWLFVRRQRRVNNPLLDLNLFSIRPLRIGATVFVLSSLAFGAMDFILVQYLQIVSGVPTVTLGVMLVAPGAAAIIGTALTPMLGRLVAPSHLMAGGLGVTVVGALVIMIVIPLDAQLTGVILVGTTIVALGLTPQMLLGAQIIVASAPKERSGSAVAIQDVSAGMGGAVGMAFIGSLVMAVYSRVLSATAPPRVSDADLDAATQSPGGGVAVTETIGGQPGADLLAAVQDAVSWGAVAAYVAGTVLVIVTIVVILRGLRGVELLSDTEDSDVDSVDSDVADEESNPGATPPTASGGPRTGAETVPAP